MDAVSQTRVIYWDGKPVAVDGKAIGLKGEVEAYLFVTRHQFAETGLQ